MIKERVENRTTVVLNATPLQHVSMTRKNRLIGLAFLCVTIPLMLVAQPAEKKTLVGVWEVKSANLFCCEDPHFELIPKRHEPGEASW